MNLVNKYRPLDAAEWVGDPKIIDEFSDYVTNSIPVLLYGPSGTGKTSLVHLVANELGYHVVEKNASDERKKDDLKDLERQVKNKTFVKTLFFMDECGGFPFSSQRFLEHIIEISHHPVVLATNELHKMSSELKNICKKIEIKLTSKDLGAIVKRMKYIAEKEGVEVTYEKVTTDIRSSINRVFYGSDGYEPEISDFEKVEKTFKDGVVNGVPLIWLIDNAYNFYSGLDFYKVIKLLGLAMSTGKKEEIMSCLPRASSGKASYPYYLRRLKNNYRHNGKI